MVPISIILPVYNGMKYLPISVESVLNQSYKNFEFLIIDDCSTDNSYEYLSALTDARIRLYKNDPNKGLFYNLNFLIKESKASLIKLWSQDDVMYPDCIEKVVAFHLQHPDVGFSYSGRHYIDENGTLSHSDHIDITPSVIPTELHSRIAFYTGSIAGNIANVTLTRFALEKVGLFNEKMKISGDFDMWVRIAEFYPVGFIRQPIIQLRNHSGQLSRQEQYYILHLEEDAIVYNHLLNYNSKDQQAAGKKMLQNRKMLFYYTLMLKSLLKGHFKIAYRFYRNLKNFGSVLNLSWLFVRYRIFKETPPGVFTDSEIKEFSKLND